MKDAWMQFWRARAPRERAVLGGGAALLVLALGYAYAWLPMQRDRAQLMQALPQLREQARQLQLDVQEVARLKALPAATQEAGNLALAIEQRAMASGLRDRIETLAPQDAGHVRVVLPQVAFEAWIDWLGELHASHGVRVESARIDATDEPGMVRVEAVLARG